MPEELRPCPHCGGPARIAHVGFSNSPVLCATNGCASGISIAAWNRRVAYSPETNLSKPSATPVVDLWLDMQDGEVNNAGILRDLERELNAALSANATERAALEHKVAHREEMFNQREQLIRDLQTAAMRERAAGYAEGLEAAVKACREDVLPCQEDEIYDNEVGKDGDGTSYKKGVERCIRAITAIR